METLLEALALLIFSTLVVVVIVPAALLYLLVRQLRRRPRRTAAEAASSALLGREWAALLRDAHAARDRYLAAVGAVAPGPLRSSLEAAALDVDVALGEARRVAEDGSRADRAYTEIVRALDRQRRRGRRAAPAAGSSAEALAAATRAQHASAVRVHESARRDLAQLQLIVARLDELAAHALELGAVAAPREPLSAVSIADRLAALRSATAELEQGITA